MDIPFDYLVSDLNDIAQRSTPERLKVTALVTTRLTLLDIGKQYTCLPMEEKIQIIDGEYKLPARTVTIEDVGLQRGVWQGHTMTPGIKFDHTLSFIPDLNVLFFPNLDSGIIWAKGYQFRLNDKGEPLIPEQAYKACYDACLAKIVSKDSTSPHWQDRWRLAEEVQPSIQRARGLLNQTTPARLRALRFPKRK